MYSHTPPVPPPKAGNHRDSSRMGTPAAIPSPRPPPQPESHFNPPEAAGGAYVSQPEPIPDPGDQWLPKYLQDKSSVPA